MIILLLNRFKITFSFLSNPSSDSIYHPVSHPNTSSSHPPPSSLFPPSHKSSYQSSFLSPDQVYHNHPAPSPELLNPDLPPRSSLPFLPQLSPARRLPFSPLLSHQMFLEVPLLGVRLSLFVLLCIFIVVFHLNNIYKD